MSESISNHTKGERIDEATEQEEYEIREEYEEFARTSGNGYGFKRLHIQRIGFEDPAPLCEKEREQSFEDAELTTKPVSVYPVGHKKICRYCVALWRRSR